MKAISTMTNVALVADSADNHRFFTLGRDIRAVAGRIAVAIVHDGDETAAIRRDLLALADRARAVWPLASWSEQLRSIADDLPGAYA